MKRGALVMPAPLPNMVAFESDPNPRKIGNFGRRSGKSRGVFRMAVLGHGGHHADGRVRFPGLAQGRDVLWLGPDYTQLGIIWNEEIKPRFSDADGCSVRESGSDGMVAQLADARLLIRTTGNLKAIKGAGSRLGGVIIDEAAHLDLANLLKEAVLPVLLDNDGWLLVVSTPNMDNDGAIDEFGNKPRPSYFNVLCDSVERGEKPGWALYEGDARANPRISKRAFAELVGEYNGPDDPKLQQEVYAKRIVAGVGVAFPKLGDVHRLPALWKPKAKSQTFIGIDWGWEAPGWAGLFVRDGARAVLWREWPFNGPGRDKETPSALARRMAADLRTWCGHRLAPRYPSALWYDSAMDAVTDGAPTVIRKLEEELITRLGERAPACLPSTKGAGSRAARKAGLDELLDYKIVEDDGVPLLVQPPRLQIVKELCPVWWSTVAALPRDPKKIEDVDTTANDHAYDGSTYALVQELDLLEGKTPKRRKDPDLDRLSEREHTRFVKASEAAARPAKAKRGAARVLGGA